MNSFVKEKKFWRLMYIVFFLMEGLVAFDGYLRDHGITHHVVIPAALSVSSLVFFALSWRQPRRP